jgi:hypothetical protein
MVSRRGALSRLAGLAGAVGLAGCSSLTSSSTTDLGLEPNPRADALPERQFAQGSFQSRSEDGNTVQARYRRILVLDLDVEPTTDAARTVEEAMRTLESAFEWRPDGLFHTLGWGTGYLGRVGALSETPTDHPTVLSRTDEPELLRPDAVLVLESDVPSQLVATERAMFGDRDSLGGVEVDARLGDVLSVASRRTGFLGEGLAYEHRNVEGIPTDALTPESPAFMGFFSDRNATQASEDRVTIGDGRLEGGTTLHLSHLTLSLRKWYEGLDDAGRVARMFSPEFSPEDVPEFVTDVPFSDKVREHAREHDVVGHHEKVAQVRRDGEPLVLRRDFNTTDGGQAGVHFLSYQRRLADFRATRRAMNGWYVRDDSPHISDRENNGILDFITVQSRANAYVPPRSARALPFR